MLQKGGFEQTKEAEEAFKKLKMAMSTYPSTGFAKLDQGFRVRDICKLKEPERKVN